MPDCDHRDNFAGLILGKPAYDMRSRHKSGVDETLRLSSNTAYGAITAYFMHSTLGRWLGPYQRRQDAATYWGMKPL
ncbi:uncharacterized protein SPSK_10816 [Sporothrix schenckii 1099-18]|uniref:Uncharacterized protein n=1 Tax=Sporothrix schenckii 1099-18 TaxID=1397361 RepID=A0A0F2MH77_SPOSC|nr:uncharacterized protein SPSK_10816 [Sporothrix schenckii 1099-18]KJR88972.1 hypothetical protein SPSK_10816 [Sporothrix schenckii 1099-18]